MLVRPVAADVVWSVPTLVTLNPIGAPIAHAGMHVRRSCTHPRPRSSFRRIAERPAADVLPTGLVGAFRPAAAPSPPGGHRRPSRRRRGSGRCGCCGLPRRTSAGSAPAGARRFTGVAGVADLAEHLTAPDLLSGVDTRGSLLQVPVDDVVPAADVDDHMVARHGVPGGVADRQVGVAVDDLRHSSVSHGEQRLPEDEEALQAAAVAAVGLPVDEADEVDGVALDGKRPMVVDQRAPPARRRRPTGR